MDSDQITLSFFPLHNPNTLHIEAYFQFSAHLRGYCPNIIQSFGLISERASKQEQAHLCSPLSPAPHTPLLIQRLWSLLCSYHFSRYLCSFDSPSQHPRPHFSFIAIHFSSRSFPLWMRARPCDPML